MKYYSSSFSSPRKDHSAGDCETFIFGWFYKVILKLLIAGPVVRGHVSLIRTPNVIIISSIHPSRTHDDSNLINIIAIVNISRNSIVGSGAGMTSLKSCLRERTNNCHPPMYGSLTAWWRFELSSQLIFSWRVVVELSSSYSLPFLFRQKLYHKMGKVCCSDEKIGCGWFSASFPLHSLITRHSFTSIWFRLWTPKKPPPFTSSR